MLCLFATLRSSIVALNLVFTNENTSTGPAACFAPLPPNSPLGFASQCINFAMAQQSQHPIDASDWHKAYPIPSPPPVPSVTPDELAAMMLSQKEEHGPGKSFLVVDVRRADCKVGASC